MEYNTIKFKIGLSNYELWLVFMWPSLIPPPNFNLSWALIKFDMFLSDNFFVGKKLYILQELEGRYVAPGVYKVSILSILDWRKLHLPKKVFVKTALHPYSYRRKKIKYIYADQHKYTIIYSQFFTPFCHE